MTPQRFKLAALAVAFFASIGAHAGNDMCTNADVCPYCCDQVCDYDPFCCDTQWDEYCSEVAEASCTSDCNGDCITDSKEIAGGAIDCNGNGVPDICEIVVGDCFPPSDPIDDEGKKDPDPPFQDWYKCMLSATDGDCNGNGFSDECEIAMYGAELVDKDANGVLDVCDFADCNGNGVDDDYDLLFGASTDCDGNDIPDVCDGPPLETCLGDVSGDGSVDGGDLGFVLGSWGATGPCLSADLDGNGVVNGADLGMVLGMWGSDC